MRGGAGRAAGGRPFWWRLGAGALVLVLAVAGKSCIGDDETRGSLRYPPAASPARDGDDEPTDFDKDGFPDAIASLGRGFVVFRGGASGLRPTGRLLEPGGGREEPGGGGSYDPPITGDVDGDGYTDLVVYRRAAASLSAEEYRAWSGTMLLRGGPDGLRDRPVWLAVPGEDRYGPFDAGAIGDVDGDGSPDLIAAGAGSRPGRVAYGPVSAAGKPSRVRSFDMRPEPYDRGVGVPLAADFDRDGRTDLLVATRHDEEYEGEEPAAPLRFFRGTPEGPMPDEGLTRRLSREVSHDGTRVRAGVDLDGDRYPDILPPGQGGERWRTYFRGGPDGLRKGTFRLRVGADVGTPLLSGDVTGDGRREFVSTVPFGEYRNRGRIQRAETGPGARLRPVQHVDLDTPGVPGDAFVSDIGKRDSFGRELQLLDADRDGHTDVLAAAPYSGPGNRYGGFWFLRGGPDGLRTDDVRRFSREELDPPADRPRG